MPELQVHRSYWPGPDLLDEVRRSFVYDPPADPRATGHLLVEDLADILAALAADLGVRYPIVAFQAYRDGSGCDWHTDSPFDAQAILSLGQTRTFGVRPNGGDPTWVELEHGDLIVMPSGFQSEWEHCVPVEPDRPGERISLVFRTPAKG